MNSHLITIIQTFPELWAIDNKKYKYVKKNERVWNQVVDLLKSKTEALDGQEHLITTRKNCLFL